MTDPFEEWCAACSFIQAARCEMDIETFFDCVVRFKAQKEQVVQDD